MTIAIALKVADGIVMASDSAITVGQGGTGNVYNNAEKLFELVEGERVACAVSGLAHIGNSTMAALLKDLRWAFDHDEQMMLDRASFALADIVAKLKKFLFEERYVKWCEANKDLARENWPPFSILLAGYSTGHDTAEIWRISVLNGQFTETKESPPENALGLLWAGDGEAIARLVLGVDGRIAQLLASELSIDAPIAAAAVKKASLSLEAQILRPLMPIKDAIELVQFLASTCAEYSRYTPGHQTIGGPIDIAAITKHEGFKWIRRKRFFDAALNSAQNEE